MYLQSIITKIMSLCKDIEYKLVLTILLKSFMLIITRFLRFESFNSITVRYTTKIE